MRTGLRLALVPGVALCLSAPLAPAQERGLDPSHIRLPGRADASDLLERIRRSPAASGAPSRAEPRVVVEAVRAALRSRERLSAGREALLALATPGPGGIHLPGADLVALMEEALASPFPEVRETGATVAGVLFLRAGRATPAAAPGSGTGLAQVLDPGVQRAVRRELNHGPGVAQHMRNAITMNKERREVYARLTGQGSRPVSNALLAGEESTVVAWTLAALDWLAADYNAQGVPLITEDVIPLRPLAPETPSRWRGRADAATQAAARAILVSFVADARRLTSARAFHELAGRAHAAVVALQALEERARCHFAMSVHLLSTVGYGALRADEHARRARPVRWLFSWSFTGFDVSSGFVSAQYLSSTLYALPDFALEIDLAAQAVHRDHGVGIVVNEFPGGFFRHVWETRGLAGR